MQEEEFDSNYWEDNWNDIPIPQEVKSEDIHEIHQIISKILPDPDNELTLIEIGCAPGGWLAYFHNSFRCTVSGIDYATQACKKTIENLKLQNIPNNVLYADFFEFEHEPYDVVFSSGFIEHFKEIMPVIEKTVSLCKPSSGLVICIIPSMQGVNRWISKTFRPDVAAGHFPINKEELREYHESCGVKTLYCDYAGSLHIFPPIEKNNFSKNNPSISAIINLPIRAWNRFISVVTKKMGIYPKWGFLTKSIIYIGRREIK